MAAVQESREQIRQNGTIATWYRRFFAPWASQLVQRANPQPGERVLDLAFGTGVVARLAAPLLSSKGAVTAIDLSPTMLSVGRVAAEGEGLDIDWRQGPAE